MATILDKDIKQIVKGLKNEPKYIKYVENALIKEFEIIKKEILKEFDNHPVTVEIEGGIYASNISGTLDNVTNLFSFIGFHSTDKPTEVIRNILQQSNVRKIIREDSTIQYIFEIPTAKEIFSKTPLPWETGRSWAKGIEQGISGLGYYIKETMNSRSGLGIQVKKTVRSGYRFKNRKYITEIINHYNEKIKALGKQIL